MLQAVKEAEMIPSSMDEFLLATHLPYICYIFFQFKWENDTIMHVSTLCENLYE